MEFYGRYKEAKKNCHCFPGYLPNCQKCQTHFKTSAKNFSGVMEGVFAQWLWKISSHLLKRGAARPSSGDSAEAYGSWASVFCLSEVLASNSFESSGPQF